MRVTCCAAAGAASAAVLTAIAVLATSDFRRERFLLPALSSAFALAGVGAAALAQRVRGAGVAFEGAEAFAGIDIPECEGHVK